ncbi:MAG: hypothetical protein J2P19_23120, partial [Pseudonocardia sp.]|nr:hypothetical protein [Pseudonocardia sp.]
MWSESAANAPRPPALRHPAEVPFTVFMAVLNVALVKAIANTAFKAPPAHRGGIHRVDAAAATAGNLHGPRLWAA